MAEEEFFSVLKANVIYEFRNIIQSIKRDLRGRIAFKVICSGLSDNQFFGTSSLIHHFPPLESKDVVYI